MKAYAQCLERGRNLRNLIEQCWLLSHPVRKVHSPQYYTFQIDPNACQVWKCLFQKPSGQSSTCNCSYLTTDPYLCQNTATQPSIELTATDSCRPLHSFLLVCCEAVSVGLIQFSFQFLLQFPFPTLVTVAQKASKMYLWQAPWKSLLLLFSYPRPFLSYYWFIY